MNDDKMNLFSLLEDTASREPERDALIDYEGRLTYRELWEYSTFLAERIAEIPLTGSGRVGILASNSRHFVAGLFALFKAGRTAVLLNPRLPLEKLAELIDLASAKQCLISGDLEDRFDGIRGICADSSIMEIRYSSSDVRFRQEHDAAGGAGSIIPSNAGEGSESEDSPAFIAFTSGTTGTPKGALTTHGIQACAVRSEAEAMYERKALDVWATSIPIVTGFGLDAFVLPGIFLGRTLALCPSGSTDDTVEFLHETEAEAFLTVPATLHDLREIILQGMRPTAEKLSRLCSITFGGASLSADLFEYFSVDLGLNVCQVYGMTETGFIARTPVTEQDKPGCGNRLVPNTGVEIRIMDDAGHECSFGGVGEVVIRGGAMLDGYIVLGYERKLEPATSEGWYFSGDLAWMNPDGSFELLGRKDDAINKGGNKIYPMEVERIVERNPDVVHAAVTVVQDARLGEDLVLYVTCRADSLVDENEFRSWLRENLPAFQVPRVVRFVESMEFSATGKVMKDKLPAM